MTWDDRRVSEQGGAGRYNRSFGGLIGAMVVIVLIVVGVVGLREVVFGGEAQEVTPTAVEYLDSVRSLQQNGFDPVYPASLPEGWIVTEVGADLGEEPAYRFNLFTPTTTSSASGRRSPTSTTCSSPTSTRTPAAATRWSVSGRWPRPGTAGRTTAVTTAYSTMLAGEGVVVFGDVSVERAGRPRRPTGDHRRGALTGYPVGVRRPRRTASRRARAPSSQLLAHRGQRLAALPEREALLQRAAAGLETAYDVDELLARLLVAGSLARAPRAGVDRSLAIGVLLGGESGGVATSACTRPSATRTLTRSPAATRSMEVRTLPSASWRTA